MLITKYENFSHSIRDRSGYQASFFHTDKGECFYEIAEELDLNVGNRLVVGCQDGGWVNFLTTGPIMCNYGPMPKGTFYVFETSDMPEDPAINLDGMRLKVVDDKLVRVDCREWVKAATKKQEDLYSRIEALEVLLLNKE